MKVGAIILARMTSSRLPGKGLKKINDREILGYIIDGLRKTHRITNIIIATSSELADDPLESFARIENVDCYRGSLDNVAERFLNAAKNSELDFAVRINGDNLFVNPSLVDKLVDKAIGGEEFVSNVPGRTFPKGMSVEVVKTSTYEKLYSLFYKDSHFEHVTQYLYQHDDKIKCYCVENTSYPQIAGKQISIDTQFDFDLADRVIKKLKCTIETVELDQLYKTYTECENKMNFKGKHGPLLIAEIGGNHEGNFEYAKKLTELAIASDSDFIKFQIYSGNTLVNPVQSPDRHKHFKKFELGREKYVELARMITKAGKRFMASIWDVDMIDWVDEYNPIYKIGSGDLLAWPLLKNVAQRGKPMIISTGLATEEEVVASVDFIRSCNSLYNDSNYLSVLQCTSMYPIPKSAANLDVMLRLNDLTSSTMGYSDHTEGSDALKVAIAMGAQVLEFHFTDTREGKEFRDHKVSLTKEEVLDVIEYIKMVNVLKGNKIKQPVAIEIDNGHVESFRRAIYPARDIAKGEVISPDDLVILRPSHGISSRYFNEVIGKVAVGQLKKYQKLSMSDFEK
jgi:sialic acid synthase SpsE/spore coat polysaccharide biosynthesis protein SpsF (cytidylyltransferase family)